MWCPPVKKEGKEGNRISLTLEENGDTYLEGCPSWTHSMNSSPDSNMSQTFYVVAVSQNQILIWGLALETS